MSTLKRYYTWGDIKAKIRRDLDIEAEKFVRPQELVEYCNEAIEEYEAEVQTMTGRAIDYFLKRETISLVADQDEYPLPAEIYAHKIRKVMFNNQSTVYEIKYAGDHKFEKKAIADQFNTSDLYEYFVINPEVAEPRIILVPTARETGPNVEIWYLRNLNRMTGNDADICDIPVFINFIFQYIKVRVYEKEGHPNYPAAVRLLERFREKMHMTLVDAQPDGNNMIEMDLSYYEELN